MPVIGHDMGVRSPKKRQKRKALPRGREFMIGRHPFQPGEMQFQFAWQKMNEGAVLKSGRHVLEVKNFRAELFNGLPDFRPGTRIPGFDSPQNGNARFPFIRNRPFVPGS